MEPSCCSRAQLPANDMFTHKCCLVVGKKWIAPDKAVPEEELWAGLGCASYSHVFARRTVRESKSKGLG